MDFFENQDRARRKTKALVFYYACAVVLIVLAIYAVAFVAFAGAAVYDGREQAVESLWDPSLFATVAAGVLLVVLAGSAYKIRQMSAGGAAVATLLGGRQVNVNTDDADEKKLLNVVEEVAIASGTAVPRVFVLDNEVGINAFAAGLAAEDAVVGVTRGCMSRLSRDELQGVIAHEFSHILNGDMRLNVRLMGVLHGILVIGVLGYWTFRLSAGSGGRRSRSRGGKGGGGGAAAFALFGLAVMAIGYIGVFFGKLIKSAVSRQREYLADAAAVQFTRNPAGIAGALKKIGGLSAGSRIRDSHAEEASHFFFCNGLSSSLFAMLATHPPLKERIRRLDPAFDGQFRREAPPPPPDVATYPRATGRTAAAASASSFAASAPIAAAVAEASGTVGTYPMAGGARLSASPESVLASIGAPQKSHMDFAAKLLAAIPPTLKAAAHEPFGARAVVYAMLLDADPRIRAAQTERLANHADPQVYRETVRLADSARGMQSELRLPIVEIALAALTSLSPEQYRMFRENVCHLAEADREIDLFEYALQRMLIRHLDPVLLGTRTPSVQYYSMRPLLSHLTTLLSSLAHWGTDKPDEARQAFGAACARLGADGRGLVLHPAEQCGLGPVDGALDALARSALPLRKRIVEACVACVAADGWVTADEADLLRIVTEALGCPMPPLLPGAVSA